jgi:hypothetical protein
MPYFASLLRQSAARIGPGRRRGDHDAGGLDLDVVRLAPSAGPQAPTLALLRDRATSARPEAEPAPPAEAPATVPPVAERIVEPAPIPPERRAYAAMPVSLPASPASRSVASLPGSAPAVADAVQATPAESRRAAEPHDATDREFRPPTSAVEGHEVERPEVAPEERTLRSVAEVVAWVASGTQLDGPGATIEAAPAPTPYRRLDGARLDERSAERVDAPARAEHVQPRDGGEPAQSDITVSVGTVDVTVEDPAGLTPAPQRARPESLPDPDGAGSARLSRHYVRL